MIEIAKALSINAKILIMDEPTSALTSKEIEDLFVIIRKLTSQGMGLFISHHSWRNCSILWTELLPLCGDGSISRPWIWDDTSLQAIITNMVGREIKKSSHALLRQGRRYLSKASGTQEIWLRI